MFLKNGKSKCGKSLDFSGGIEMRVTNPTGSFRSFTSVLKMQEFKPKWYVLQQVPEWRVNFAQVWRFARVWNRHSKQVAGCCFPTTTQTPHPSHTSPKNISPYFVCFLTYVCQLVLCQH